MSAQNTPEDLASRLAFLRIKDYFEDKRAELQSRAEAKTENQTNKVPFHRLYVAKINFSTVAV